MDTEGLRSFVRAAELGNYGMRRRTGGDSAGRLEADRALERELGVRLFTRTPRASS